MRKQIPYSIVALIGLAALLLPETALAQQATEPWQGAYTSPAFAGGAIRSVFCDLVGLIEGNFGALLVASAAVLAVASAAFGDFKHGTTAIMVAVGAFTISAGVSLYFGDMGCNTQAGAQLPATGGPLGNGPANVARTSPDSDTVQAETAADPELEADESDPFDSF